MELNTCHARVVQQQLTVRARIYAFASGVSKPEVASPELSLTFGFPPRSNGVAILVEIRQAVTPGWACDFETRAEEPLPRARLEP